MIHCIFVDDGFIYLYMLINLYNTFYLVNVKILHVHKKGNTLQMFYIICDNFSFITLQILQSPYIFFAQAICIITVVHTHGWFKLFTIIYKFPLLYMRFEILTAMNIKGFGLLCCDAV
jgi:hypothetical protein